MPRPAFKLLPALRSLAFFGLMLPASAAAQSVSATLGGSLNGAAQPSVSAGLSLRNAAIVAGFGLDARLLADIGQGGGLELAGLLDVPLSDPLDSLTFYFGPGLALNFGAPFRIRPSLTGGLTYDLDGQLSLFAEASYQFQGQYRARAGVSYNF